MTSNSRLIIANSLEEAELSEHLSKAGPDVRHVIVEKFGIADARGLVGQSSRRSFGEDLHNFVIVANSLTLEAQNALLKLFEEPPEKTVFHLVIPSESLLIPTLRSRFVEVITDSRNKPDQTAENFLAMSLAERMNYIADQNKKDPASLEKLVTSIGRAGKLSSEAKKSLLLVDKYVYNRGASRKALLEELALSL